MIIFFYLVDELSYYLGLFIKFLLTPTNFNSIFFEMIS